MNKDYTNEIRVVKGIFYIGALISLLTMLMILYKPNYVCNYYLCEVFFDIIFPLSLSFIILIPVFYKNFYYKWRKYMYLFLTLLFLNVFFNKIEDPFVFIISGKFQELFIPFFSLFCSSCYYLILKNKK